MTPAPRQPRTAPVGACPLCGAREAARLFEVPDRLHGTPGVFTYHRCASCWTVFQDPRVVPEDLPLCYPEAYSPYAELPQPEAPLRAPVRYKDHVRRAILGAVRGVSLPGFMGFLGRVLARNRRIRERAFYYLLDEMIPRAADGGRALDVGCGAGELLAKLTRAGWDAEGIEWNPRIAEIAARRTGRRIAAGGFLDSAPPSPRYRLVVLHHVFEHLSEPTAALGKIRDLLEPGGRAVLVYPNPGALGARVFASAWHPWEPPRHLVLADGRAVVQAAVRLGFASAVARTSPRYAAWEFAISKTYRAGRPDEKAQPGLTERIAALVERALVALGFAVGEELIVVLRKAGAADGP